MSSKTKLIVLKSKELIYTGIFIAFIIFFIVLLIIMFSGKKSDEKIASNSDVTETSKYIAGIYTSTIMLGDNAINVEVSVDYDHINSVRLVNIDESVTTMYPLLNNSLAEINNQISTINSIDELNLSNDNLYTNTILEQAIKNAVEKAKK